MIRRRNFISLIGGATVAWPVVARAQQGERVRRIAILFSTGEKDPETPARLAAMRLELQSQGWSESRNLKIDVRYGNGMTRTIEGHAAEIVGSNPDAILVLGTVVASAVQNVSRSIPIVFTQVSDPVQAGIVSSLSHPAGNVTGFTTYEFSMVGKWLEILTEIAPKTTRVMLLLNPENAPQWAGYRHALERFLQGSAVQMVPGAVSSRSDLERRIEEFAHTPNGGMIVPPDAITSANWQLVVDLGAKYRVPTIYAYRNWAVSGGLLSYGIDVVDHFRQASRYVGRILKGEKPADLPVVQSTKVELIINLKTAKVLGLNIPLPLIGRADAVIE